MKKLFKSSIKKIVGLLFIPMLLTSISCSSDNSLTADFLDDNSNEKYDENNYEFNTIPLWGSEIAVVDCGDYYQFQGDIHLNKNDIDTIQTRGAARIDKRWPDNVVSYEFKGDYENYSSTLYSAIKEIEQNTYLTFKYAESGDRIIFTVKETNEWDAHSDYIGHKGGVQNIVLSSTPASRKGTIMHEICHALGLFHEMCRTDRDNYIRIDFSKLTTDEARYQYKTYKELGMNGVDVGPFDFFSIMLYDSFAFGEYVSTKLDGSRYWAQRSYLSNYDVLALAKSQPATKYTFYPESINSVFNVDEEFKQQRSKILRCPEGAKINLLFKRKYSPQTSVFEGYDEDIFNITTNIRIENIKSGEIVFNKKVNNERTDSYIDEMLPIDVSPGIYRMYLTLEGNISDDTDDNLEGNLGGNREAVLRKLMYWPTLYLQLDEVKINNKNIFIPKEFGQPYELRSETFIKIG